MAIRRNGILQALRLIVPAALCLVAAHGQTISYSGFASTAGLKLDGSASLANTADGTVLRLTQAKCCLAGSVFTANPVPFLINANTFSTFFQFRITNPGGIDPADGIFFVVRGPGSAPLGATGGNQGYDGIGQSVGIKLDTYQNAGEINDNHVAIQTNGVWVDGSAQSPYGVTRCTQPVGVTGCMSNGDLWSVWIDYDGATIHVAVADNSLVRPADLIAAPLSVPAILSYAGSAYVGFTAGTGGGFENHDIVNWRYFPSYNPTAVGTTQTLTAHQ